MLRGPALQDSQPVCLGSDTLAHLDSALRQNTTNTQHDQAGQESSDTHPQLTVQNLIPLNKCLYMHYINP